MSIARPADFNSLPNELVLRIFSYLDLQEIVGFITLKKAAHDTIIWSNFMNVYFPQEFLHFINVKTITLSDFRQTHQSEYAKLTKREKQLFNWVKEGSLQALQNAGLGYDDFLKMDKHNYSLIDWATMKNHQPVLDFFYNTIKRFYLRKNSTEYDLNLRDKRRRILLHWAILCRQEAAVIDQISTPQNVHDADSRGRRPIQLASQRGLVDVMRVLVNKSAEVDEQDREGATPLYLAAAAGHEAAVSYLLSLEGISTETETFKHNKTPIYIAAQNGHANVIKLLGQAPGVRVNVQIADGSTPLCIAAKNGHLDAVVELINYGADFEIADAKGFTPLMLAGNKMLGGIVNELLLQGASWQQANLGIADLSLIEYFPGVELTTANIEAELTRVSERIGNHLQRGKMLNHALDIIIETATNLADTEAAVRLLETAARHPAVHPQPAVITHGIFAENAESKLKNTLNSLKRKSETIEQIVSVKKPRIGPTE